MNEEAGAGTGEGDGQVTDHVVGCGPGQLGSVVESLPQAYGESKQSLRHCSGAVGPKKVLFDKAFPGQFRAFLWSQGRCRQHVQKLGSEAPSSHRLSLSCNTHRRTYTRTHTVYTQEMFSEY